MKPFWIRALLVLASAAVPSTQPSITLIHHGKTITAVKTGPDSVGFSVICGGNSPKSPVTAVYFDTSKNEVQVTVAGDLVQAPLMVMHKQPGGDGTLTMSDGTARLSNRRCMPHLHTTSKAGAVTARQGSTHFSGSRLYYTQKTGDATLSGPITFSRKVTGQAPLEGSSQSLVIVVSKGLTTLEGKVRLVSGKRVSTAPKVIYSDPKGEALLIGTAQDPASSKQGKDLLTAATIRFNLRNGDVVAVGRVSGTLSGQ